MQVCQGCSSFEESPKEQMHNSEATYSWGQDSLSCEFFLFIFLISIINSSLFLALHQLLLQMDEHCNTGNVNSALAQCHFQCFDLLADEFMHHLHHLAGEDFSGTLVDMIFNKEGMLGLLDIFIQEVEDNDIQELDEFNKIFKALINGYDLQV
jgi:hypothetical protein